MYLKSRLEYYPLYLASTNIYVIYNIFIFFRKPIYICLHIIFGASSVLQYSSTLPDRAHE